MAVTVLSRRVHAGFLTERGVVVVVVHVVVVAVDV